MADDLVKRLRSITNIKVLCKDCYQSFETADEAADRIEALEAALRFYAEYQPTFSQQDFRAVARAALAGEKKDD